MEFERVCPDGAAKLNSCRGKTPPRPEQLKLVMQWPYFGLQEEIFAPDAPLPEKYCFRPKGLNLFGDSGTGKTVAAWLAIKKSFLEWEAPGNLPGVFPWRAAELGRAISDASRGGEGDLNALSRRLNGCALLFIDDIDKAKFTPRVESELFDVMEARELKSLPIIVTTNALGVEFVKLFSKNVGRPIANRLIRMCYAIDFDDPSFNFDEELAEIQADIREQIRRQVEVAEQMEEARRKEKEKEAARRKIQEQKENDAKKRFEELRALLNRRKDVSG